MALERQSALAAGDRQSRSWNPPASPAIPARGTAGAPARETAAVAAATLLGRAIDSTRRPLDRLLALRELRVQLEQLEAADVAAALAGRDTLMDVARALGASKSAIHRKHGGRRWTP